MHPDCAYQEKEQRTDLGKILMGQEHQANDPTQEGHLSDHHDCPKDPKDDRKSQSITCILDLPQEVSLHHFLCSSTDTTYVRVATRGLAFNVPYALDSMSSAELSTVS